VTNMINNKQTVDARTAAINKGGSIIISQCNGITCTAERSGDGKTLRFVRSTGNSSKVFKVCKF
jgi:hypothetical protein